MGNANTKESRRPGSSDGRDRRTDSGDLGGAGRSFASDSSARHPAGRGERSFLGLGGASSSRNRDRQDPDAPFEHRETRQERDARKLECERAARAKERERSLREEHVDGGHLVTLGTYTGSEDFSKPVVRQLQIERKLAPFWRGLDDWSEGWTEQQRIAAARGLPIPAADAPPDPNLLPQPPPPQSGSIFSQNLEIGSRTDTPSPATTGPAKGKRHRTKSLAHALSLGSRNSSSTDLTPRELWLPHDPFVNGQSIEGFLYKNAAECPICFLTYPPYLNHTRCCDQSICSECFVQIKRADPHLPEHHPDGQARDPNQGLTAQDPPEMLISEPSACPYCQQPDFGVTYEPPPFRRGLVISSSSYNLASSTAMSSQSSLNSTLSPGSPNPIGRRRTHSLSANAPNVITTDRVRPDWATKLASARSHQARRAAAATALHTAAFLMGGTESRSRLRAGRFSRRNTGANSGGTTPGGGQSGGVTDVAEGPEPGERGSSRNPETSQRSRMEELEDMMFMEAVRLSLVSEEEHKRKMEKAYGKEAKEAKKREQAERKALKKQGKQSQDPYEGGGANGASESSLSLRSFGLGRKRGNSAASNLRTETTLQETSQSSSSTLDHESKPEDVGGKGKGVDRGPQDATLETNTSTLLPIPTRGGSHLRQMSNASSLGSSPADSPSGSYTGQGFAGPDGPRRLSLGNQSEDGNRDTGSEPMFNFRSLAELVGVNIDDGSATRPESTTDTHDFSARPLSQVKEDDKEEAKAEHVEESTSVVTGTGNQETPPKPADTEEEHAGQGSELALTSPEAMIAPEAPEPANNAAEDKRPGQSSVMEHQSTQIAQ